MKHSTSLRSAFERIIGAHRAGLRDRMQSYQSLQTLFDAQNEKGQRQLCEYLEEFLQSEPLETRGAEGVGVNMPALALLALSTFGSTENLIRLAFSRVSLEDSKHPEAWASEVGSGLSYCVSRFESRFSDQTLQEIKGLCSSLRPTDKSVPLTLLNCLKALERTVEHVEFARFEHSLLQVTAKKSEDVSDLSGLLSTLSLNHSIEIAMKQAENYLRSAGEFDPKIASDLIRACIEELHKAIVDQLEAIYHKPCSEKGRDGSRRGYMRDVGFISAPEEKFFSCIYSFISQEGSHKLIAPRETVMVLFRTVSDYLILLLKRLSALHQVKPK